MNVDSKYKSDVLVSVIVPVYNGSAFLRETLVSILNSSQKNIEVILINDGSTDDSGEICKEFERNDERVVVIEKENGGIASARNTGLQEAKGDYIVFCDQDDLMHKDMILRMVRKAEKTGCQYVACSIGRAYGERVWPKWIIQDSRYLGKDEIKSKLIAPILFQPLMDDEFELKRWDVWGCIFKRSIIIDNKIHFFSFLAYEDDLLFTLNYLRYVDHAESIGAILYLWRYNLESESNVIKYRTNYTNNLIKYEKYLLKYSDSIGFTRDVFNNYIKYHFKKNLLLISYNELIVGKSNIRNRVAICKRGKAVYKAFVDSILNNYYEHGIVGVGRNAIDSIELLFKVMAYAILSRTKMRVGFDEKLFTNKLSDYGF